MAILSPFRYPGAKNKLLPIIMKELAPYIEKTKMYTEPFVGGGSVALEVAEQYPNKEIFLNDKDPLISAFWFCVIDGQLHCELNDRIKSRHPNLPLFYELTNSNPTDPVSQAYKAIMLNRLSFSGIIGAGPIGGKDQSSKYKIDCRFNANDLVEKINHCHTILKNRAQVFNTQAILMLNGGAMYLDPPYWDRGDLLYPTKMTEAEHYYLSRNLQDYDYWILSYDNNDHIKNLYKDNVIQNVDTLYSVSNKKSPYKKAELLIRR